MSGKWLIALLPALCFAQTVPSLNNQSSYTTGNVTVNLGNGQAVLTDNGGHVITVTVAVDPRVDLMKAGLKQCSDAIGSVQPVIARLLQNPTAPAQAYWQVPLAAAKPLLDAAKANADTYLP